MICVESAINFCLFFFGKRYRLGDLSNAIPNILNKLNPLRNAKG